jgi:hypothetical protein
MPTGNSHASYWLKVKDLPTGPFDAAQVHAKLAAGEATWDMLACKVGEEAWFPLVQMPGIGPVAAPLQPVAAAFPPAAPLQASGDSVKQKEAAGPSPSRSLGSITWSSLVLEGLSAGLVHEAAQSLPVEAAPSKKESPAASLRAQLLQDLNNVELRMQYLAARPQELKKMDQAQVWQKRPLWKVLLNGVWEGAFMGFFLWLVVTIMFAAGCLPNRQAAVRWEKAAWFAHDLGCVGSVIAGIPVWTFCRLGKEHEMRHRARLAAELGPLPADAPTSRRLARERFLAS